MRFRVLSQEELQHLEAEFKQFLIVNHIHSDDWKKINESEPEKAVALVELFSDTVLLKVYEKVDYMEFRSKQLFSVYRIHSERIETIHVKSEDHTVSLETDEEISLAIQSIPPKISIYRAEKKVNPFKEDEVHRLVEQGCSKSTDNVWSQFSMFINTSS
ncbi:MAG: hypothetical protein FJZ67_04320 [Bacteroidetes bacterium]|nr:hypothetical protein [Bacteroidota bacterium]